MTQCYASKSLEGLNYRDRWGMVDYYDSLKHLVMFGMYRNKDYQVAFNHKSTITIVWTGSDSMDLNNGWVTFLKSKHIKHISISHWITEDLKKVGIKSKFYPVHACDNIKSVIPRGDFIHFYSSDESPESAEHYGEQMIGEIISKTGLNVIRTAHGLYNKFQMQEIYKKCFINLRLTTHDGCPNTNLEMGLMGRRSIFNGNLPHSIKWNSVDDVCESIWNEYNIREKYNGFIANDIHNFLNIPNEIFL